MGGSIGTGSSIGTGAAGALACPDILAPTLQTYSLDVAAADWAAIQHEFLTAGALIDQAFVQYQPVEYPVVFHYGAETVRDATIHLRGDSSWREAAVIDGANGKMQISIAFDSANPDAAFHGIGKIKLDMPRTDPTFLRERVANSWLRTVGYPGRVLDQRAADRQREPLRRVRRRGARRSSRAHAVLSAATPTAICSTAAGRLRPTSSIRTRRA